MQVGCRDFLGCVEDFVLFGLSFLSGFLVSGEFCFRSAESLGRPGAASPLSCPQTGAVIIE